MNPLNHFSAFDGHPAQQHTRCQKSQSQHKAFSIAAGIKPGNKYRRCGMVMVIPHCYRRIFPECQVQLIEVVIVQSIQGHPAVFIYPPIHSISIDKIPPGLSFPAFQGEGRAAEFVNSLDLPRYLVPLPYPDIVAVLQQKEQCRQ